MVETLITFEELDENGDVKKEFTTPIGSRRYAILNLEDLEDALKQIPQDIVLAIGKNV